MDVIREDIREHAAGELREEIIAAYRRLHESPPAWAWPFVPSIPFVGERFSPGSGVMVYASAENFRWMTGPESGIPARFQDERAWDRYRCVYEQEGRCGDAFFP